MADVRPFRALFAPPALAAQVASVPYDVVDTAEARALAAGNPHSYLHVTRAEIDLPAGVDEHADEVYARGRAALLDFLRAGTLREEPAPVYYLYRLTWQGRSQTGVVGAFSVEEYARDLILKHEQTRPDKQEDRTRHIVALEAHAEPVFLLHRPQPGLAALVAAITASAPLVAFEAPDGVGHALWRVSETGPLRAALSEVPRLYVADGHHRTAAALQARARLQGRCERFLAVSFPSDEVRILPYHRLILDAGGRAPAALLGELEAACGPLRAVQDGEALPGEARVYLDGAWRAATLRPLGDDPVSRLDPQALQERVLGPLFGITDPRTDQRIKFVGGIRGTPSLARAVDEGRAALAFALAPVQVEQLLRVADAGLTMPPKSTWFEPKLRSGLFVLRLEPGGS